MRRLALLGSVLAVWLLATPVAAQSNDPAVDRQWGLKAVKGPDAWATTRGGGVIVAIVDSGVDLGHEDLRANLVGGYNAIDPSKPPQDDHGHGTHVAGIAAAVADNGRGIAGVAPQAKIMPVRVLRAEEDVRGRQTASGSIEDVIEGIKWAVDHGAKVVNLSLGDDVLLRTITGSSIREGLDYAWSKGAVPVVAAGNDILFPSGYGDDPAIVVSATNRDDRIASYSNGVGGAQWGMAAPGGEPPSSSDPGRAILSSWLGGGYAHAAGTSMAAPHVSGAAAMLFSRGLGARPVVDTLLRTATDLGASGRDGTYGAGLLNAAKAVASTVTPATSAPQPQPPTAQQPEEGSSGTDTPASRAAPSRTRRGVPAATATQAPSTADPAVADEEAEATSESASGDGVRSSRLPQDRSGDGSSGAPLAAVAAGVLVLGASGGALAWWRLRRP